MRYAIEGIARTSKEARERKGLSQRELSARSGVRQYQISKFENGAIDLRLSSLIELARALDLELTLVPHKSLSAVNSIIRSAEPRGRSKRGRSEWTRLLNELNEFAREHPDKKEYVQIQNLSRTLQHLPLSKGESGEQQGKYRKLFSDLKKKQDDKSAELLLISLRSLRNRLTHEVEASTEAETVKPAYSLDEDDNG